MPITDEQIAQRKELVTDRYLSSVNSYWGALLTINGLILSLFSVDFLIGDRANTLLVLLLVSSSTVSMWLLILNFRELKRAYYILGKLSPSDMPDVPLEKRAAIRSPQEFGEMIAIHTLKWRKKGIDLARRRHDLIKVREDWTEGLLFLETLLIVIMVVRRFFWAA